MTTRIGNAMYWGACVAAAGWLAFVLYLMTTSDRNDVTGQARNWLWRRRTSLGFQSRDALCFGRQVADFATGYTR